MSNAGNNVDRLLDLADAMCDKTASADDLAELDTVLLGQEASRRCYLDYCWMHVSLQLEMRAQSAIHSAMQQIDLEASASDDASGKIDASPGLPVPILTTELRDTVGHFSTGWPIAYLVATVVLLIGIGISAVLHVSRPAPVAQQSAPGPASPTPRSPTNMDFVGRITGMVACQWADPQTEAVNGAHVPLGRRYALAAGLLEITYDTGAKVILQGPVTYEVDTPAGGFLSLGKLTAKVQKKEEQRTKNEELSAPRASFLIPHSYFAVRTPTATVTDLGTEFGVEVNQDGNTTSHVFRGSVEVQATAAGGATTVAPRVLHANESAVVTKVVGATKGAVRVVLLDSLAKPAGFVRALPRRVLKTLDLVDVVAGGNGFGSARNRGIDPATGRLTEDRRGESPNDPQWARAGDGRYHRVEGMSLVDGVFIPGSGKGPTQLDSAGHVFEGFQTSDNCTSGCTWAGSFVPNDPDGRTMFHGVDYASPGHGLLSVCANQGITFDLDAIRRANPNCKIVRFAAVAANTETISARGLPALADVWVFVDGQVRKKAREINEATGAIPISIALTPRDRFLTLATTDAGNSIDFDWVMFGDPRLEMAESVSADDSATQETP